MGLLAMIKGEEPNPILKLINYKNKGQYGEYLTTYALGKNNIEGYRKIICNAYIPYKNHMTEIDIIMIHEKGIFIFESKNYSGWIFGNDKQLYWVQTLRNGEKNRFYNPLMQNETHCIALSEFLQIDLSLVTSFIVFSERCELKTVPDSKSDSYIVKRNKFLNVLRSKLKEESVKFLPQEIDAFAEKLFNSVNISNEQKQDHIDRIKIMNAGEICPLCNGHMIKRTGRYGKFFGCSNYPKCKYTRKTDT